MNEHPSYKKKGALVAIIKTTLSSPGFDKQLSATLNQSRTLDSGHWTGHWTLDTGHWTLDTGHWTLDTGHSKLTKKGDEDDRRDTVLDSHVKGQKSLKQVHFGCQPCSDDDDDYNNDYDDETPAAAAATTTTLAKTSTITEDDVVIYMADIRRRHSYGRHTTSS